MKKAQNNEVVVLIESYNFHIKIIFIRVLMKIYSFFKVRLCHADGGGVTILYCHTGGSSVISLTRGICAGRPIPSAPHRANVAHLVTPMHVVRYRVFVTSCRVARLNGLRSANIFF